MTADDEQTRVDRELARLAEKAATALARAPMLDSGSSEREKNRRQFFDDVFEIGLILTRHSGFWTAPAIVTLVAGARSPLAAAWSDVIKFMCYIDSISVSGVMGFGGDVGWRNICYGRSALSFFCDIFDGQIPDDERGPFAEDLRGTDQTIRKKGDFEGHISDEEIPDGIPRDHWWWWYPRRAP